MNEKIEIIVITKNNNKNRLKPQFVGHPPPLEVTRVYGAELSGRCCGFHCFFHFYFCIVVVIYFCFFVNSNFFKACCCCF